MPKSVEVTTPSEREIKVTRRFAAPARLVFDFHTKPEHVQKWLLGPPGWSMPICEIDLRVGGRYRYVWRNDANGAEFGIGGEYREIAPPSRIVQCERMDGCEGEVECTLSLAESGGGTTLSVTMVFDSQESRDRALKSGMSDGMAASYDRLEEQMGAKAA